MSLNVNKLAQRLKNFENGQKANQLSKLVWKPKEGLQTIRIVPYKFNLEVPFIELKFYYNLAGKHYLAPCTFGKPDPIQEVIERLRASGSNEEIEIAKKLNPTPRTYLPIIVRGEEHLGVRFWGFAVTIYKQLLEVMTNVKYGDITSLTEGRDIDIKFTKVGKKKGPKGETYSETSILVDPSLSPAVDPTRKDLLEKLKDQTNILDVFPLQTYEELKSIVDNWLVPEEADPIVDDNSLATATTPTPSPTVAPPTAPPAIVAKSVSQTPSATTYDNEFEKFFKTQTS